MEFLTKGILTMYNDFRMAFRLLPKAFVQREQSEGVKIMPNPENIFGNKKASWKKTCISVSRQRKILPLLVGCLLALGSLALAAPSTLRITIGTFAPYYSPTMVNIKTGTPILWDNPTGALHSITHDECKNGAWCAFDSGPLGPNATFTINQLPPGSYSYHCTFHPIMRGVLVVQDSKSPRKT